MRVVGMRRDEKEKMNRVKWKIVYISNTNNK